MGPWREGIEGGGDGKEGIDSWGFKTSRVDEEVGRKDGEHLSERKGSRVKKKDEGTSETREVLWMWFFWVFFFSFLFFLGGLKICTHMACVSCVSTITCVSCVSQSPLEMRNVKHKLAAHGLMRAISRSCTFKCLNT